MTEVHATNVNLNLDRQSVQNEESHSLTELKDNVLSTISLEFSDFTAKESEHLDQSLIIDKNKLTINIDRFIEKVALDKKSDQKKDLNDVCVLASKKAVKEFLAYVMKQEAATKQANAEADGDKSLVNRMTITGTRVLRFFVQGNEFQVEIKEYKSPLKIDNSKKPSQKAQLLKKIEKLKQKLIKMIQQIKSKMKTSGSSQAQQAMEMILTMVTEQFSSIKSMSSDSMKALPLDQLMKMEKDMEKIEKELDQLMNELEDNPSEKDMETINMLSLEMKDNASLKSTDVQAQAQAGNDAAPAKPDPIEFIDIDVLSSSREKAKSSSTKLTFSEKVSQDPNYADDIELSIENPPQSGSESTNSESGDSSIV